ncbi:hypothetical protein KHQ82_05970 [Mycoplasmatota bacterium]|nr:hypothetical protein KHQ82_05970 [Mycoplasmatota bacterium]
MKEFQDHQKELNTENGYSKNDLEIARELLIEKNPPFHKEVEFVRDQKLFQ